MKPGDSCNPKYNTKDRKWREKEVMTSQGGGRSNPSVLRKTLSMENKPIHLGQSLKTQRSMKIRRKWGLKMVKKKMSENMFKE